jgi:hypothetical protein
MKSMLSPPNTMSPHQNLSRYSAPAGRGICAPNHGYLPGRPRSGLRTATVTSIPNLPQTRPPGVVAGQGDVHRSGAGGPEAAGPGTLLAALLRYPMGFAALPQRSQHLPGTAFVVPLTARAALRGRQAQRRGSRRYPRGCGHHCRSRKRSSRTQQPPPNLCRARSAVSTGTPAPGFVCRMTFTVGAQLTGQRHQCRRTLPGRGPRGWTKCCHASPFGHLRLQS